MRQDHDERRQHVRQAVLLPCRLDGVTNAAMQVVDLSAGGCFVATRTAIPSGSQVTVYARLGGAEVPFTGRIVHVRSGRGFAMEFVDLASDSRLQLEQFLTLVTTSG